MNNTNIDFYCPYCNQITSRYPYNYCLNCNVYFSGDYIEFKTSKYYVGLQTLKLSCSIYNFIDTKPLLVLDYIPNVSPANVNDWAQRVMKLKAFL